MTGGNLFRNVTWTAALFLAFVLCPGPAWGQATPRATLELSKKTVELPEGARDGKLQLYVKASGLTPPAPGATEPELRVEPLGESGRVPVEVADVIVEELPRALPSEREWRVSGTVSGLPPNSEASLSFRFVLEGTAAKTEAVTFSNKAEGEFQLVLVPPPELLLQQSREAAIQVKSGPRPVPGLKLIQSTLQDEATKVTLGLEHLRLKRPDGEEEIGNTGRGGEMGAGDLRQRLRELCRQESSAAALDFAAGAAERLDVIVCDSFKEPGHFKGNLSFAVAGQASEHKVEVEVYSSPLGRRVLGVVAIAAGIALYLFIAVYARNHGNRLEALRALAAMRERLQKLRPWEELKKEGLEDEVSLSELQQRFKALEADLTEEAISQQGFFSPLPSAIGGQTPEARAEALKEHLAALAARLRILDEIVDRGVRVVLGRFKRWTEAGHPFPVALEAGPHFLTALTALDAVAEGEKTFEEVKAGVKAALDALEEKLEKILEEERKRRSRGGFEIKGLGGDRGLSYGLRTLEAPSFIRPPRTAAELVMELSLLNQSVWLIWGIVVVALGYFVLILPNPGFGTLHDLFTCFFWGLGLQTAGQQLQSLSPNKVSSRFGLTLPGGG